MKTVVKTDYQDIYRLKYGVLLVVNKFETFGLCFENKSKPYNKYTQGLRISTQERTSSCDGITHPKGEVTYYFRTTKLVDRSKYTFAIKTSGEFFSGNSKTILGYMDEIKNVIQSYQNKGECK